MTSLTLIPLFAALPVEFYKFILIALIMLGGPLLKKITDAREQAERAKKGKPPGVKPPAVPPRRENSVRDADATWNANAAGRRRRLPAGRIRSAMKSSSFSKRSGDAVLPPAHHSPPAMSGEPRLPRCRVRFRCSNRCRACQRRCSATPAARSARSLSRPRHPRRRHLKLCHLDPERSSPSARRPSRMTSAPRSAPFDAVSRLVAHVAGARADLGKCRGTRGPRPYGNDDDGRHRGSSCPASGRRSRYVSRGALPSGRRASGDRCERNP